MSGRLEFGGNVSFGDRRTGGKIDVSVWGVFEGTGVDPHEAQPIKEWIMNALASSALAFDGDVHELPKMAGEWGAYVSQQISPQLAQYFNAHGQLHILGVEVGGAPAKPMAPAPAPAAPAQKVASSGGSVLEAAAAALSQRMGVPLEQARQAAAIVLEVAQAQAGAVEDANAKAPYAGGAKDAYPKDPYGKGPDWKK